MILLHDYWRSSAGYRVRIALHLKQLPFRRTAVNLRTGIGEQHSPAFLAVNPQGLVPVLVHGGEVITQSMAILEYLEEAFPEPSLLPMDARARAAVRSLCQVIVADIHPINNLRVQEYLAAELQATPVAVQAWISHWLILGLDALETRLSLAAHGWRFCAGHSPGLADVCLVPQLYNARRFGVSTDRWPRLSSIEAACLSLPAFAAAAPEVQEDAPSGG